MRPFDCAYYNFVALSMADSVCDNQMFMYRDENVSLCKFM